MNVSKYFLVFFAILVELVGLIYYSLNPHGLFYGFEFLLIVFLIGVSVIILLTLGYDTRLPIFLLLLFFIITALDALLLYFLYDATRLFAVMIVISALGIILAIRLFDSLRREEKGEIKEISEGDMVGKVVAEPADKTEIAEIRKTARKRGRPRKKKAGRKSK